MWKANRFLFFVFGLVILIGCNSVSKSKKWPKNVYLVNNGGCMYRDTLDVHKVADDLYMDENSNLYLLTEDRSEGNPFPIPVLISRFYNGCEGDSTFDLKYSIDITTFKSTGDFYYKDKNHRYYHKLMSDGGNFVISD